MQIKPYSIGVFLIFILAVLASLFFSTAIIDTGDGLAHFKISKFSWDYPELLLDHWGKPLFTLLSSPFAQFGFGGMIVFNLLCALLTGHFVLRAGKRLGIEQRWLILLCLFAAPIYFKMVIAGLTEILFAMLCAWAISLLLDKRFAYAAIILSLLPFSRPEAYVVLPFFALYILWQHWKVIPLLLTGTVIYSIIGALVIDDMFWLINRDPYASQAVGVYGFGKPFDFIKNSKDILGIPISIIFLLGVVLISVLPFDKSKTSETRLKYWMLLILPAGAILTVHSYLWWKGLNGSAGLKRVIATSVPMMALVAGAGLDKLLGFIPEGTKRKAFLLLISFVLCFTLYNRIDIIVENDDKQATGKEASRWAATQLSGDQRVFYLDPLVGYELGIDPYDQTKSVLIWSMEQEGPNAMQSGDILFWEAHFAPNEGKLPKESVFADPSMELIYELRPEVPYPIWDTFYEVLIFRKK